MSAFAEWEIDEDGVRLDRALGDRLELSRSKARALLDLGVVEVEGRVARDKGLLLEAGQRVKVLRDPRSLDTLVASERPLPILAEGEGWIAVDKPAGLPVHPLRADEKDSVLQRLVHVRPSVSGVGEGGLRSGVVHRLDVDTSGVQLFALDEERFAMLRDAFSAHRIDKVYRAIVQGHPDEHGQVEVELEIVRHRPARVGVVEASKSSRHCPLRWRVVESFAEASLVEVRPHTGFLHQVRVTMAWLGHPLLGDALYGDGEGAARHLLHASRLTVGAIEAASPDPDDFTAVLDRLRGGD